MIAVFIGMGVLGIIAGLALAGAVREMNRTHRAEEEASQ